MEVELISIGNEILSGRILNTNAAFISQELRREGLVVTRQISLPDNAAILRQGLQESFNRAQLVIATGGLGPTCDDLTREVAAELFESDFYLDPDVAADLAQRYGDRQISLENQATVPRKAKVLRNALGTAPGLILQNESNVLILLPGVPPEMKALLTEQVIPFLRPFMIGKPRPFTKQLHFYALTETAVDPILRKIEREYPAIQCGIYPGQGVLSITLTVQSLNQEQAFKLLEAPVALVSKSFAAQRFESASGKLSDAIHQLFMRKRLTLGVAESCTGGNIAAKLTELPDASKYFLGGIVPYTNQLKIDLLGVPAEMILAYGAVSEPVVRQMCLGTLDRINSDYAIAISGIAGPSGGTVENPVGTLWCAIGKRGEEPHVWKTITYGTRAMIVERATHILLGRLYSLVNEE